MLTLLRSFLLIHGVSVRRTLRAVGRIGSERVYKSKFPGVGLLSGSATHWALSIWREKRPVVAAKWTVWVEAARLAGTAGRIEIAALERDLSSHDTGDPGLRLAGDLLQACRRTRPSTMPESGAGQAGPPIVHCLVQR